MPETASFAKDTGHEHRYVFQKTLSIKTVQKQVDVRGFVLLQRKVRNIKFPNVKGFLKILCQNGAIM